MFAGQKTSFSNVKEAEESTWSGKRKTFKVKGSFLR